MWFYKFYNWLTSLYLKHITNFIDSHSKMEWFLVDYTTHPSSKRQHCIYIPRRVLRTNGVISLITIVQSSIVKIYFLLRLPSDHWLETDTSLAHFFFWWSDEFNYVWFNLIVASCSIFRNNSNSNMIDEQKES